MADEMPIAVVQPLLRPPGMTDDDRGLTTTPLGEGAADAGTMAVVPGGLDEDPARMRVAGLRDRPAPFRPPDEYSLGTSAQVGHELAGTLEALEVHDLRQQDHGREGIDAAEAAEPADGSR